MLKTFSPELGRSGTSSAYQAAAGEFPARPMVYAPVSVAPMIDKTHRHFRRFLRLLTKQTLLYTEMLTPSAIIHGDRNKLLDFDEIERPIALQLGGDDPEEMAEAIRIAEDWGYDEYNLNVGCPSDRVQNKNFGACLMADSPRVADLLKAMYEAGTRPVSVKHRIGIQSRIKDLDLSAYEDMRSFVLRLKDGPAQRYSVHARVAILEGLSPKENRNVPPLRYDEVYRLKEEFPELHIEINGGIKTHGEIASHLQHCDGAMLGRLSYERPWRFASMDRQYYGRQTADFRIPGPDDLLDPSRREILEEYFEYMKEWSSRGMNVRSLVWPVLELFAGQPGSRRWKQTLSRALPRGMSAGDFLDEGLASAPEEFLDIRASDDPLTSE